MAQYSDLKAYIEEKIYENGTQAITGDILQDVLKVMTDDLGEFYQTGGVASPSTDPGTPDAKVIYFATEAGTYTNFGGITLAAGEVALLVFDTTWTKVELNVLSSANGGVKTANLADGAVTTGKIADGAVETAKIADNAVTSGKVADGAIGTAKIADGAIDADKIAANAVESAKIKNGAVTEGKINDGAVTAGKIASNAVTTAKIKDDAVTSDKIANYAVGNVQLASGAVHAGNIADGAVTAPKIGGGAVTSGKIGSGAVTEEKIADGAVTTSKIAEGAVGSDQLAEGAFSAQNLADGSVTTDKLADDAVTAEKIADGAVTAGKFANGSVTTIKLGSGAVITEKIGDGMVTRQKLADSSVSTSKIIDGAVTTAKIADGNVTTAKIADANVTTGKLADGAVTTAKIADGNVTGAKLQEGVRPVINVNALNEETAAYGSAALARAAVPSALRILGLHIIYLLAGGWFEDEYIGSDVSGWGTASNWRAVGPVSVSQNTLTIGGEDKGELAGQLIESPEWVQVVTDSQDRILYGVKSDGKFYFGGGCPPQVQEYVTNYIEEYGLEALMKSHFDYYNVSKHHSYKEYFNVYTVNDGWQKITYNSSLGEYYYLDIYQIGEQCNFGGDTANSYQATSQHRGVAPATITQDFIIRPVYTLNEALEAIPNDIKSNFFAGQIICFTNANDEVETWELQADDTWSQKMPTEISNPEFIQVTTDSEGKILSGRKTDGSKFENLPMEFKDKVSIDGNIIENIQDPEGRSEITTDSEGKILSYRDKNGVLHEDVGIDAKNINTESLSMPLNGMIAFGHALKDSGFSSGTGNWSDYISEDGDKPLNLATPRCAVVNIIDPDTSFNYQNINKKGRSGAIEGVNYDRPVTMEFWDMQGNYFKKPIIISGQGQDSMNKPKKNFAFDLFDSEWNGDAFKVRFGRWVAQDSFHLKAFWYDYYHCKGAVGFKLYDSMVRSHGCMEDYMWKKALIDFSTITPTNSGITDMDEQELQFESGATCFPDGFPCVVYINGQFWGVYSWNLKKHRDVYHMNKKESGQIHLDGRLKDIWYYNGNIDWRVVIGAKADELGFVNGFEVRNPKDLYVVDVTYSYIALDAVEDADEIASVMNTGRYTTCTDNPTSYTDSYIRNMFGYAIPTYLLNTDTDIMYRTIQTPTGTCSKYDSDINNHELIDDTMACYDSENKNHKRTNQVKKNLVEMSKIMPIIDAAEQVYLASSQTAEDLATLKSVFETYFDVQNLIDYMIFADVTNNSDGWGWNWQIISYGNNKWYVMPYDLDETFWNNIASSHQGNSYLMFRYITAYYNTELEASYAEYRNKKIIDSDKIVNMFRDWMDSVGKDYYMMEYQKWDTETYRYNSIYRLKKWVDECLRIKDQVYHFSN